METTDWDSYGTGRYEKCANCMAHCGYEPTAADATISRPWQALKVALFGPRTQGPDGAGNSARHSGRPNSPSRRHVEQELAQIQQDEKRSQRSLEAAE